MPLTLLKKLHPAKIIIFGLGIEGWSTYHFLHPQLPDTEFWLIDDLPLQELDKKISSTSHRWKKIIDQHPNTHFARANKKLAKNLPTNSVLYKTPGVPLSHPIIKQILTAGAVLSSNTQLFFTLIADWQKKIKTAGQIITIGVTGTKGKSTTAAMIYQMLNQNQFTTYLGGNIGQPVLELWQTWRKQNYPPNQQSSKVYFVLELSCHQLAELKSSPNIAVIQAITQEHLDYYANFHQYFLAKSPITRFQQPSDLVIYNADTDTAAKLAKFSPGEKIAFSLKNENLLMLAKHTTLLGRHNFYNILPAIIIGQRVGLTAVQIITTITSFKALPHRLELVANIDGVTYYDDSISTVPESTLAAMQTFAHKPIILIAGGFERGQNLTILVQTIQKSQIKAMALLGPTGQRLFTELKKIGSNRSLKTKLKQVTSMTEAVKFAHHYAKAGDVVLLSPAAASFGMFRDYRHRGEEFAKAARSLLRR